MAHVKYKTNNNCNNMNKRSFKHITMEYKSNIFNRINFNKLFNQAKVKDFIDKNSARNSSLIE